MRVEYRNQKDYLVMNCNGYFFQSVEQQFQTKSALLYIAYGNIVQ